MDKKSMLEAMISHYTNGNKAKFATLLGVSAQTISAWTTRNTFDTELIYTKCSDISADWLLSGEGAMLHDSEKSEETKWSSTPIATPVSPTEESIIYKMYKDEKEENKALIEEIGGLKERIRQLESQNKEPEHHSKLNDVLETFTSDSSGDYTGDLSPTKPPTISKRLSAGKI